MNRQRLHRYPAAALIGTLLCLACGCAGSVPEAAANAETIQFELSDEKDAVTDADKQEAFLSYLQNTIKQDLLESFPEVEHADVALSCPGDADLQTGTDDELLVNVILKVPDGLSTCSADELAGTLAKYVGNPSTDQITIYDAEENLLFPETK